MGVCSIDLARAPKPATFGVGTEANQSWPLGGLLWFWIHSKHLFCSKNIPWAKNGSHKTVKSDESSLNHSLLGPFLAQGMFFEQNKCLKWIQNHNKPLVWPLTCYLKQIYFGVFLSCIVKSMGPWLWVSITLFRDVSSRAGHSFGVPGWPNK